jgi:hypothetical protein
MGFELPRAEISLAAKIQNLAGEMFVGLATAYAVARTFVLCPTFCRSLLP